MFIVSTFVEGSIKMFKQLPKFSKILVTSLIVIIAVFATLLLVLNIYMIGYRKDNAATRATLVKNNSELIGTRFEVPRDGKDNVKVNLYIPDHEDNEKLPVIFNIHGGGFVGGDADLLDTQSDRISKEWHSIIVTINYTKADVKPIEYGVEEIKDTILYFRDHANEYHADPTKFSVLGYSAGGYYAASSAIELDKSGFKLASQILCYAWSKFLPEDQVNPTVAPALFVLASEDPISQDSRVYEETLRNSGIKTEIKEYQGAKHSFIESNNPEGYKTGTKEELAEYITPEQEKLAREAESDINSWLQELYKKNN